MYGLPVAAAREACSIVFAVAIGFLAVACYVVLRWSQYFATRWCGLAVAGRRSQHLAMRQYGIAVVRTRPYGLIFVRTRLYGLTVVSTRQ